MKVQDNATFIMYNDLLKVHEKGKKKKYILYTSDYFYKIKENSIVPYHYLW